MSTPQTSTVDTGRQQKTHELAIEALAKETKTGVDRVRELYEAEHARLAAQARIKTYVAVFATRLVRNALQGSQHLVQ
jgi:Protein of unknown function (DUF3562)